MGAAEPDGSFDIQLRLCGMVDPSDNLVSIRFPDGFFEITIDEISFQHRVSDIVELAIGDHIRFCVYETQVWHMGWVRRKTARTIYVELTCEPNRNELHRFRYRSLSNIMHVPMIPEDIIEKEFDGDLG